MYKESLYILEKNDGMTTCISCQKTLRPTYFCHENYSTLIALHVREQWTQSTSILCIY